MCREEDKTAFCKQNAVSCSGKQRTLTPRRTARPHIMHGRDLPYYPKCSDSEWVIAATNGDRRIKSCPLTAGLGM